MADRERVICPGSALLDAGPGVRFRIHPGDADEKGFVVRSRGKATAFVNRCPHAGTELDWQPGEFFDLAGIYLVCSTHGALFEPGNGRCVAGPCRGASLEPLAIREQGGEVMLVQPPPGDGVQDTP